MSNTVREMLAGVQVREATAGDVEALRAQTYRALVAASSAEKAAEASREKAKRDAKRAKNARARFERVLAQLQLATHTTSAEDALPEEWCRKFEAREDERRAKARARRKGAGHTSAEDADADKTEVPF